MDNHSTISAWAPSLVRPIKWGFVAAIATALVLIFVPNEYKSEVRILPADARGSGSLGSLAAAAAAVGVSVPGQESADAAYVDILNSRWLRENLLNTKYRFHQKTWLLGSSVPQEQTLLEYLGKKNLDRGIQKLRENITISRDLRTKLLTISVETRSPELSQQVARKMAALLEEFVLTKSSSRGGAKAAFAEKRLAEAREAMNKAEDAFSVFLGNNRNFQMSTDPTIRLQGTRLEAELRLRTQLVTTLAVSREQALLEEKNDMPILNVLDAGNLPEDKSSPARGSITLLAFVLVAGGAYGWWNRVQWSRWLGGSVSSEEAVGSTRS